MNINLISITQRCLQHIAGTVTLFVVHHYPCPVAALSDSVLVKLRNFRPAFLSTNSFAVLLPQSIAYNILICLNCNNIILNLKNIHSISRRVAVKSTLFGLLTVSVSNVLYASNIIPLTDNQKLPDDVSNRYPAIQEAIVSEVVGVSHFNLDRLKTLVDRRPELARATWDWGFGDWETAIGAASHVGRKDIVDYLLSKGARPDIFTFAMLGSYSIVKSIIEFYPGVQQIAGPHGISLLQHVKNGISNQDINATERNKLINYLEQLGNADGEKYMSLEETEKQKYLGDYKYGTKENEGFSIKLNTRKLISLGKLGKNGGALYRIGGNKFIYNGVPSVTISFLVENGKVISLTVTEPDLILTATKL